MPFRYVVARPDEIARMKTALDEAWTLIEAARRSDPLRVPGERERLAHIIIRLWEQDAEQDLTSAAVERFNATAVPPLD